LELAPNLIEGSKKREYGKHRILLRKTGYFLLFFTLGEPSEKVRFNFLRKGGYF
jgi:hypothetical protein